MSTQTVSVPRHVFDEMLTALREARSFVLVETGHMPTVNELRRVIRLAAQAWDSGEPAASVEDGETQQ